MRLNLLDGFRGYFLLFMMVVHVNGQFHSLFGTYNHHALGFVEDAQGFVFISGFVVALVYTKLFDRKGQPAMVRGVFRRIRTIYTYQAAMILAFCAAALLLAMAGLRPDVLRQYVEEPVMFTVASLFLTTGSMHMGILALYIWLMLATPLVLIAFDRGRVGWVAALSILSWLFAQSGLPDDAQGPIEGALRDTGHGINIGIYFNVFGWQIIYMLGLWLGFLFARDRLDTEWLRDKRMVPVFWLAALAMAGFALFDRSLHLGWLPDETRRFLWDTLDRGNMDPVYLTNFLIDLFVISWLLVAGRARETGPLAAVGKAIAWVFTRRPLVFLGQHSLQVFSAHVVITYIAMWLMQGRDLPALADNLLVVLCLGLLFATAWGHARLVAAKAARREVSATKGAPDLARQPSTAG